MTTEIKCNEPSHLFTHPEGQVAWQELYGKSLMYSTRCVYLLSFPNGKNYIGYTTQWLRDRLQTHWSRRDKTGWKNKPISVALCKWGLPAVQVLQYDATKKDERTFMSKLGTLYPAGLNVLG